MESRKSVFDNLYTLTDLVVAGSLEPVKVMNGTTDLGGFKVKAVYCDGRVTFTTWRTDEACSFTVHVHETSFEILGVTIGRAVVHFTDRSVDVPQGYSVKIEAKTPHRVETFGPTVGFSVTFPPDPALVQLVKEKESCYCGGECRFSLGGVDAS